MRKYTVIPPPLDTILNFRYFLTVVWGTQQAPNISQVVSAVVLESVIE
jgi:hypothetical protein